MKPDIKPFGVQRTPSEVLTEPHLTAIELEKWKKRLAEERVKDINDYWDSRHKEIDLSKKRKI